MIINCRKQIKEALETVCDNVKIAFPSSGAVLPLLVYSEVVNVDGGKWETLLEYQIDVYTNDFGELLDLTDDVDNVMKDLGFNRNYISADSDAKVDIDLYHKAISYDATVNTNEMNII